MVEFHDRELYLVKKALTIAVLAIERNDGPFQAFSDMTEMKGMLDRLVSSNDELAHLLFAARIQVEGKPD